MYHQLIYHWTIGSGDPPCDMQERANVSPSRATGLGGEIWGGPGGTGKNITILIY